VSEQAEARKAIEDILRSESLGVLATHDRGQPCANLVTFAASPDLRRIIFPTRRGTRKFSNLSGDSRVALLIDTRKTGKAKDKINVVTAIGIAREIPQDEYPDVRKTFLEQNPDLKSFVEAEDCAIISIEVDVYNLVREFEKVVAVKP